jgi:FixJ family two-component response regulator
MAIKLFITENDEDNILVYKLILSDFQLTVSKTIDEALSYIQSDDFNTTDAVILDVNLDNNIKIGGYNLAYRIIKKKKDVPIIICTGFADDNVVVKNAKLINATLVHKPIDSKLINTIISEIERHKAFDLNEIELKTREFITGAAYLKNIIEHDFDLPIEYLERIDVIEKIETSLINAFGRLKDKDYDDENNFMKALKNNLKMYITNLLDIANHSLYSQLNIGTSEIEFIEEISSTGELILKDLENIETTI